MADKIYEYKDKENWFLGEWVASMPFQVLEMSAVTSFMN